MKERDIIFKCKLIVNALAGKMIKLHGNMYQESLPDTLILFRGIPPMWCEFKVPGKVPTPAQNAKMAELERFGCIVAWHDSVDTFEHWVKDTLQRNGLSDRVDAYNSL